MKVSVKELMKILSELPTDVYSAEEIRIGNSIAYFTDSGDKDDSKRVDFYITKSTGKKEWLLEWPTVKSEKILR